MSNDREFCAALIGSRVSAELYGLDARAQAIQDRFHPEELRIRRPLVAKRGSAARPSKRYALGANGVVTPIEPQLDVLVVPPDVAFYGVGSNGKLIRVERGDARLIGYAKERA